MRAARVYRNSIFAGILKEESNKTFRFDYDTEYLSNEKNPAISLTLPRSSKTFRSDHLFPFFFNMLAEGVNRKVQLRQWQISDNDHFGLLLATSSKDTIGAVTLKEIIT